MKSFSIFKKPFALGAAVVIATASIAGGLASCSKSFLDVPPQGDQTPEDFFSGNPNSATSLVNAVYNKMLDWNLHTFSWIGISSITSDDADKGSDPGDTGTDKHELDGFTFTPTSLSFNEVWEAQYQGIARANQALKYLPNLTIEDGLKKRLIGEVKFLRAYFYFNMVRSFGGVPKVDRVPDPTNATEVEAGRVRATKEQIYQLIEEDLKAGIESLPDQYPASDVGRITKGAAKTMLAKVSMYQKKWSEAQRLTDEVMVSGQYGLVADYATIWRESGQNSRESIFEVQGRGSNPNKGLQGYVECQSVRGQWGWGFNTPTESLYKAYETGDPRRDATIIVPGETLWDGEKVNADAPNPRYNKKAYLSRTKETFDGNSWESNKNLRILRYAEVLLINAEAANELGQAGKAVASLNQVRARARAGNKEILPDVTTTTQSDLRLKIWQERRVELAFEHDRFFDIVRQGRAAELMRANGKNFIAGKHELFPVPQKQIDLSGGKLTQNPGY